jgi:gamma-glutamylcyclotransferase (GGCT)/AIG2-like uncharacterized protein YtfP
MVNVLTHEDIHNLIQDAPTPVAVFAYGTLRPGEGNSRWLQIESHTPGCVYGYGLYARPNGHYPWMVETQYTETKGDLIWVEPGGSLLDIINMELRAGYEARIVRVYTETMDEPIPAIAFIYPPVPFGADQVTSGDWTIPN